MSQPQGKQTAVRSIVLNINNNMKGDIYHPSLFLFYAGIYMKKSHIIVFLYFCFISFSSAKGISVGGTRFVYMDNKREITIPIFNSSDKTPFLIQSWVTGFDEEVKAPFIATPALFRVEPNSYGSARITYIGKPLSSNQEKIYLLNIKSIPPKNESVENELQIIINSQFKFFLRSKDIQPLNFDDVNITKDINGVKIDNRTPYHLSIKSILINGKGVKGMKMIHPWMNEYVLKQKIEREHSVKIEFINDYGAIVEKNMTKS
ncbi:TPA: fimbrial biogenesis chaperone [Providencia alcalifaciens]